MELKKPERKIISYKIEIDILNGVKDICDKTGLTFVKVTNYLLREALKRYNDEVKK